MLSKFIRTGIERKIGYRFKQRSILDMALIHPSYRHESDHLDDDNQRLEFLGDAALGLAAAADLYRRHADMNEGDLTHRRSQMANRTTLAAIGKELGLGELLQLGKGEEKSGGRERESNLTDAVEAIMGAVYLDGGQKAVDRVFARLWRNYQEQVTPPAEGNPKGILQEFAQKKWKISPVYEVVNEVGPAHAREYICSVSINGHIQGEGRGASKRVAEGKAAQAALASLQID
jgi:ribonuclease-3